MGKYGILISLMFFALVVNIPFGYWRTQTRKFSFKWMLYVHLPVPLIIYLRYLGGISYYYIPLMLVAAITGQYAGGKIPVNK